MQTLTLTSRSATSLLRSLNSLPSSSSPLLFALSPNVQPSALSSIVDRLGALSSSTVGCLSAPLNPGHVSCSLAFFPENARVFRSTIPGREAPTVGRWHAFRDRTSERVGEFSSGWAGTKSRGKLPDALQGISPTGIVYLTDRAPEGLLSALDMFPNIPKLGLIASSTPFITGRPFTLFHNGSIHDSGAVGIALTSPLPTTTVTTRFTGCTPISPLMTITQCEGNMVNALDGSSPTQLLLSAIRKSGMDMDAVGSFKDDETFLLGDESGTRMYRITAGDPSRGPISIEPQNVAPPIGSQVQFFHLSKGHSHFPALDVPDGSLNMHTCSEDTDTIVDESDGECTVSRSFKASSENGFVVSGWTCSTRGGCATL